jgi:hypothetical protein
MTRQRLSKVRADAGRKGGARSAQKGEDFLEQRGRKGGKAVLMKFGRDYYVAIQEERRLFRQREEFEQ